MTRNLPNRFGGAKDDSRLLELLYSRALNFLSYRDRSIKEISDRIDTYIRKLAPHNEEAKALKGEILRRLGELGLLDDEKFARSYIEQKCGSKNPLSNKAIRQRLFRLGIPKEVFEKYLDRNEAQKIKKLIDKKLKTSGKTRESLYRFLAAKGFSPDEIKDAFDTYFKVK